MNQSRGIIAFLLCVAVFFVFELVIKPSLPVRYVPRPQGQAPAGGAQPPTPGAPVQNPVAAPADPSLPVFDATPTQPEKPWTLETACLRVELTNRGAALKKLTLKTFRAVGGEGDMVLLDEYEARRMSCLVRDRNAPAVLPDLDGVNWELVVGKADAKQAVFRYARADGLTFTKTFAVADGDYLLRGSLVLQNRGASPRTVRLQVTSAAGVAAEGGAYFMSGVVGYEGQGKRSVSHSSKAPATLLEQPQELAASDGALQLRWFGTSEKYFAAVMVPEEWREDWLSAVVYEGVVDAKQLDRLSAQRERALGRPLTPEETQELRKAAAVGVAGVLHLKEVAVPPGDERQLGWHFFAGPKDQAVLEKHAALGLPALLDYGFWAPISKALLWLLLLLHAMTGNYGVSVILLTILVRLCLFPISRKAQVSMYRMQKLQPQLAAIREKHKSDKQRQTVEQMKLFRENRVSPWGSCFPLLLQMPVFIGLYSALSMSIELRQAPFALWIRDLSQPDRLCPLPFPILGATDFNLLPILMLVPMVVQQALTPKPADPSMAQQQKMMMWMMPAMFLLMCYSMPAGISLYWFFSSLWGVFETRLIKKIWMREGPQAAGTAGVAPARP